LAIQNYLTALKLDSDDAEIYDNLGTLYEKKGLYQEALDAYKKAYTLNPESVNASERIPKLKIRLLQEKTQNQRQVGEK